MTTEYDIERVRRDQPKPMPWGEKACWVVICLSILYGIMVIGEVVLAGRLP